MEDRDLKIIFTRGSGPGGQHKNKVETCVVVTHVPTGLQERCQDTRSRERNLNLAKERLENKIQLQEDQRMQEQKNDRRKELIKTQQVVRTYNYNRNEVYDHRTKTKHDLKKFMKGETDL
jgi:peptide chain release factor 1